MICTQTHLLISRIYINICICVLYTAYCIFPSVFLGWVVGIGLHVVCHILHDILNFHKILIMHKSAQFDVTHISFNSLFFAIVVATLLFYITI